MTNSLLKIVGFCCINALDSLGTYQDLSGKRRVLFEPEVVIIQLPCSSKVETLGIIKAFESGADGIFILGCPEKTCHFLDGNYRARKTINYTKKLLNEIGIEKDRLEMFQPGTQEGESFDQIVKTMTSRIKAMNNTKKYITGSTV